MSIKIDDLSLDEKETSFTQSAQDRKDGIWNVFSCDAYWMKRLDETPGVVKVRHDGVGAWYTVPQAQIRLAKPATPRTLPSRR